MIRTTLKFSVLACAAAVFLTVLAAAPVRAMEAVPQAPVCRMYQGENSLEALQARIAELREESLHNPGGEADGCEKANIHYQLARLLPDQQKQHLNTCIQLTQTAIDHDARAGVAHFFKGLCLGRLGETKGIWGSLNIIGPFRESMEVAASLDPALDSGGPHRALGRLYFKLPLVLGGDLGKSIEHLQKAVTFGPQYWENHFFLAESYYENKQYAEARTELQRAIDIESQLSGDPGHTIRSTELKGLMQAIENHIH